MEFLFPLRVYIEDTDTGGIVYYVNYLKYMERARTELLRAQGYEQQSLKESGLIFVVHSVNSRYLRPAFMDNELQVKTAIKTLSSASILFQQAVIRVEDKVVLCTAEIKIVSVSAKNVKPIALPINMTKALSQFVLTA
ncbi:MAG: tol-pal system-associated acyl-CoA thioesterase [Motiliproteus sp.]